MNEKQFMNCHIWCCKHIRFCVEFFISHIQIFINLLWQFIHWSNFSHVRSFNAALINMGIKITGKLTH